MTAHRRARTVRRLRQPTIDRREREILRLKREAIAAMREQADAFSRFAPVLSIRVPEFELTMRRPWWRRFFSS